MTAEPRAAWHPDRSWADPLIALLALLALLAVSYTLAARRQGARRPAERASLQGRLTEVALAGPKLLAGRPLAEREWTKAAAQLQEPWDRALLAVLKAELGEAAKEPRDWAALAAPEGAAGAKFRRACLAAYDGAPLPDAVERREVHRRLGDGYAADLLEARLQDREGGGEALRAQARAALMARLVGLGGLGLLVLSLAAVGLAVGLYLVVTRKQPLPRPLPAWSLSGRAATLVGLAWFLAFFVASNLAALLLMPWPSLRWLAVPLGYLMHAGFGVFLLGRAEGIGFQELWRRVVPGRTRRDLGWDLAWGTAFLAVAVFLVITVALTTSAILKPDQSPQRELQELLRGLSGWGPGLALFLTVAVLAPCFEELLFRGFLLPVLARNRGMTAALLLSALLFGAIHLQPLGLPVLSTLGLAMGLAMRQTGSLRTPILVHGCWNGGLFLLMRAFA